MAGKSAGVTRKLDFGYSPTTVTGTTAWRAGLQLAPAAGPGKYRALARRRRLAQIRARHALDALASDERTGHPTLREVG
jgi:hypothetical protein